MDTLEGLSFEFELVLEVVEGGLLYWDSVRIFPRSTTKCSRGWVISKGFGH